MLVFGREQGTVTPASKDRSPGTPTGNREPVQAAIQDAMFRDLPEYLRAGDLLVLNDSRVLPARLFARRAGMGTQTNSPRPAGLIEVLLTEEVDSRSDSDPTSQTRDVGHPPLSGCGKSRFSGEHRRKHVPGAKARIDFVPVVPGLKSRHNGHKINAGFS